jgi:hypothetical protein
VVGATGFEPATACAWSRRAASAVRRRPLAMTRERQDHNDGRLSIQFAISVSIHAMAFGPSRRGAGNVFSCTMRQTVDRPRPTRCITSAIRSILAGVDRGVSVWRREVIH